MRRCCESDGFFFGLVASLLSTHPLAVSAGGALRSNNGMISFQHVRLGPAAAVAASACRAGLPIDAAQPPSQRGYPATAPPRTRIGMSASRGGNRAAADDYDGGGPPEPVSELPPATLTSTLDEVSDEEVLLACRAYLRRHRRVGWTQHERRRRARSQALAPMAEDETGAVGYFWENPEELVYLRSRPTLTATPDGGTSDLYAFAWDGDGGGSFVERKSRGDDGDGDAESGIDGISDEHDDDDDDDEAEAAEGRMLSDGLFTSFPSGPSEEHLRRSAAQQKKWTDPRWRKMWYDRRWGADGEKKVSPEVKRRRKLEAMVGSIPPEVLNSTELAEITEQELAHAVRTYLQAGRRRGDAHKRNAVDKETSETYWKERIKREAKEKSSPVKGGAKAVKEQTEEERLRELQQKRSEKSAKAYQTRLANQRKRPGRKKKNEERVRCIIPSSLPHVLKAQHALERLEWALFADLSINPSDIEVLLVPGRMSGRRDVLLRILNERLHLRGKCVPDAGTDGSVGGRYLFATNCPVKQLGKFVVDKLREEEEANCKS